MSNRTSSSYLRPTQFSTLKDVSQDVRRKLSGSRWILKNQKSGPPLFGMFITSQGNGFRFDRDFLHPANPQADWCVMNLDAELASHIAEIHWSPHDVLVLDNWNTVHARGALAKNINEDRELERLEFWPDEGMAI
jgi:hypothetical protein